MNDLHTAIPHCKSFMAQGRIFEYFANADSLPGDVIDDSGCGAYYWQGTNKDAFVVFDGETWIAEYWALDEFGMGVVSQGYADTPIEAAEQLDFNA